MRILVTGTAGFIGYHLTRRLAARGDEVVGLGCMCEHVVAFQWVRNVYERQRMTSTGQH